MPLFHFAAFNVGGNTAGATSSGPGSLVIAGGPNVTLSGATGQGVMTLSISVAAPGGGGLNAATTMSAVASNNVIGTNTARYAPEDHQHAGVFSLGASNVGNTAGNTTVVPGRFVIAGSDGVTVSQETAAAGLYTLHIQAAAAATTASRVESANVSGTNPRFAREDHQHAGLYQISVGGNTSGTTTAGAGSFMLAGGPNITLSMSTAAGGGTISVSGPAPGTYELYQPFDEAALVAGQVGQGSLFVRPFMFPNITFDRLGLRVIFSATSNSTGSITLSQWFGIYTKNASTLSLLSSTSGTYALTFSGTGGDYSLNGGPRVMTIGWTTSIAASAYWVAVISRTTSGGANASFSQYLMSQINSNHSGVLGVASNNTQQRVLGFGTWSATTSAMPSSIAFTAITGSGSVAHRAPIWFLGNGTV